MVKEFSELEACSKLHSMNEHSNDMDILLEDL